MPKIKGASITSMREILKEEGADFKARYLAKLGPEEKCLVEHAIPVSWREIALDENNNEVVILAKMLYPSDPQHMEKLGYRMAGMVLPKFYQIFIRVPSPDFIFQRVAKIWSSFYDQGHATIENYTGQQFDLVLHDFPEYPQFLCKFMIGFVGWFCQTMRLKDYRVVFIGTNPNAWTWHVTWINN